MAIALFCVGGLAHQTLPAALYTLASDVFGCHELGTATGLAGMSGYLGATLFSLAVGTLVTAVGYDLLFVALAVFNIVAAIVLWMLLPDERHGATNRSSRKAAYLARCLASSDGSAATAALHDRVTLDLQALKSPIGVLSNRCAPTHLRTQTIRIAATHSIGRMHRAGS
ncbi:hypothetical protein Busp01_54130 [Trinickia caryophylli]|uniref:Major Facilitator Superfamily protein n=1 Tax=Trinickia caryophylli TaxID=28094 RepID=A0A1X7H1A4_TRICW|nr:hypothetical protein Busp01_54130 [Trinickia caryophylli]SMF77684.1 Major Facilitator Superfamily protein [Trinickia caryophylli]